MRNEEKYFADDRVVIPKDIKDMSLADIDKEIARLEKEEIKKKDSFRINSISKAV